MPTHPAGDIVRVDHSVPVVYPEGYPPLYPDLPAGPSEFSLDSLDSWLHVDQKTGRVSGTFLHKHLRENLMLESCLGLVELQEIQKLGIDVFRRHFDGTFLYGWRSVARRGGRLAVPCLLEDVRKVGLFWFWLEDSWGAEEPAIRFGT